MPGSLGWVYRLREGERFVAKKQASTEKKAKPAAWMTRAMVTVRKSTFKSNLVILNKEKASIDMP